MEPQPVPLSLEKINGREGSSGLSCAESIATFPAYQRLALAIIVAALSDTYLPRKQISYSPKKARAFLNEAGTRAFCDDWDIPLDRLVRAFRSLGHA